MNEDYWMWFCSCVLPFVCSSLLPCCRVSLCSLLSLKANSWSEGWQLISNFEAYKSLEWTCRLLAVHILGVVGFKSATQCEILLFLLWLAQLTIDGGAFVEHCSVKSAFAIFSLFFLHFFWTRNQFRGTQFVHWPGRGSLFARFTCTGVPGSPIYVSWDAAAQTQLQLTIWHLCGCSSLNPQGLRS